MGMGMGKGHPSITRHSVLASSSLLLQWESDGTGVGSARAGDTRAGRHQEGLSSIPVGLSKGDKLWA